VILTGITLNTLDREVKYASKHPTQLDHLFGALGPVKTIGIACGYIVKGSTDKLKRVVFEHVGRDSVDLRPVHKYRFDSAHR
jgi:hypothetical protein